MIRQRAFLIRHRNRVALIAVVGLLSLGVAAEHSGLGHDQPQGDGMGDLASMCLAIADAAAVALLGGVAALGLARSRQAWPIASVPVPPAAWVRTQSRGASPRAGPPALCVFRR